MRSAGEGPVFKGSSLAASLSAFLRVLDILKVDAGGILPKLLKTASWRARRTVVFNLSRLAVATPQ